MSHYSRQSHPYGVTATQNRRIHRAMNQAQGSGSCTYYDDGPCCVIAQLASIEGASDEVLADWDQGEGGLSSTVSMLLEENASASKFLGSYPAHLLNIIQQEWDSRDIDPREGSRDRMQRVYRENRVIQSPS